MKELIANFPEQLTEALSIGHNYSFKAAPAELRNIVLSGLGGSGIGGSIAQNYSAGKISVPFVVNKDYFLPAFVDHSSLVIICSYSGNTEETLAAMKSAIKLKATVVCITSGGEVEKLANKKGIDCIVVPGGMPPRACLGYSLVQLLYTLANFGFINYDFEKGIKNAVKMMETGEKEIKKTAKAIAAKLNGKIPVIYSAPDFEGVAIRFRQQINENSKMLCWHAVIPEMNHNELVGWRTKNPDLAVVILRNEDDYERVQMRIEINKKIIKKYTPTIVELVSQGKSYFEKAFYLIHVTDWVSVMLADLNGHDATEVNVITSLKAALSDQPA